MRAIEIKNKQLSPTDREMPCPGQDEVLIQVKAAGVNRPDLLQVKGLYPPPPGVTDIPGLEVSGLTDDGQRVCALIAGGGYGEYVSVPKAQILPIPKGMDFAQAAALPEGLFTVWRNLHDIGQIKAHQNVLIHGGAGGIGHFAIQLAKLAGAYVYTTAGSADKCDFCKELGANVVINYKQEDFANVIKQHDTGLDLVLDMVGGDYIQKHLDLMNDGARHVSISFLAGPKVQLDLMPLLRRNLTMAGSVLRSRPVEEKAKIAAHLTEYIWPHIGTKIMPHIDRIYPLEDAQQAHQHMRNGAHKGKIVLTM